MQGFPSLFYSKEPLPTTTTILIKDNEANIKCPKITWSTQVVDLEQQNNLPSNRNTLAPYFDNDEGLLDCADLEDNYEINITKSGKFKTIFYLPSALLPFIIGPKGYKLRQLQEGTQTLIKIPRRHEVGEPIKITGHSERSVASARNQITILALSKREKLASTHFISIPVTSADIKKNFETFKKTILKDKATRGLDEAIFQNPYKLHMTIEVLTILDEIELKHCKEMLLNNVGDIFGTYLSKDQYGFRLRGLEIMNDDPSEVDVLYAKVEMNNQNDQEGFQNIIDEISNMFYIQGYVRKHYDSVKLHVTLMNSLFRKEENGGRSTFDASYILDQYKDYNFGTGILQKIDLSVRFTTDANGYYKSEISVPLKPSCTNINDK